MKTTAVGAIKFWAAVVCALGFCVTSAPAWQSDNGDGTFANPPPRYINP